MIKKETSIYNIDYYRIKIWKFYLWIQDTRKSTLDCGKKNISINCFGLSK